MASHLARIAKREVLLSRISIALGVDVQYGHIRGTPDERMLTILGRIADAIEQALPADVADRPVPGAVQQQPLPPARPRRKKEDRESE